MTRPHVTIAALARTQHGVVTGRQLEALGMPRSSAADFPSGSWVRIHPGVYRVAAAPESYLQTLWAAFLAAGTPSVVSHEAAAKLHGLTGFGAEDVVLTTPRSDHHRIAGAVVHQSGDVFHFPGHMTHLSSLPVTTVARTLVDLGAVARRGRLTAAMDDAIAHRQTSVKDVRSVLVDVSRRGKRGLRQVVRVLARHEPGRAIPSSRLERLFIRLLAEYDEVEPERQSDLPGCGRIAGLVPRGFVGELQLEYDAPWMAVPLPIGRVVAQRGCNESITVRIGPQPRAGRPVEDLD